MMMFGLWGCREQLTRTDVSWHLGNWSDDDSTSCVSLLAHLKKKYEAARKTTLATTTILGVVWLSEQLDHIVDV